jgi:hypothetical protein
MRHLVAGSNRFSLLLCSTTSGYCFYVEQLLPCPSRLDRGDEAHHRQLLDVLRLPSEAGTQQEAGPQEPLKGDVPCAMCETFVVWVEHQLLQNKTKQQILYVSVSRFLLWAADRSGACCHGTIAEEKLSQTRKCMSPTVTVN